MFLKDPNLGPLREQPLLAFLLFFQAIWNSPYWIFWRSYFWGVFSGGPLKSKKFSKSFHTLDDPSLLFLERLWTVHDIFFYVLAKGNPLHYILFLFNFCVDSKQSFWSGTDSTKSSFGPTTELTAPQRICLYLIKKGWLLRPFKVLLLQMFFNLFNVIASPSIFILLFDWRSRFPLTTLWLLPHFITTS